MLTTIATFLFGGLKWLKDVAGALFSIVRTYPLQTALILALAACAWLWLGKERVEAKHADLEWAFVQYQADVRHASEEAIARATREKREKERAYEIAAKEADSSYVELRNRYRSLLAAKADTSSARRADLPLNPAAPGVPENSAGPAEFRITNADALKCADVSAYAMAAFEWAEKVAATSSTPRTESP